MRVRSAKLLNPLATISLRYIEGWTARLPCPTPAASV